LGWNVLKWPENGSFREIGRETVREMNYMRGRGKVKKCCH